MSLKVSVLNKEGQEVEKITLPKEVFGVTPNLDLIAQYIRMYQANQSQGTHKTKTRSQVSGGGKKPWNQKHTGRARAGSSRSPVWVGGGISHGPVPYTKRLSLNKAQKRGALVSALSCALQTKSILVLDRLDMDKLKTKDAIGILNNLKIDKKALLVISAKKEVAERFKVLRSFRNLSQVSVCDSRAINAFELSSVALTVLEKEVISELCNK
ncbi:50S ribosomal protein L4 [Candidatus Parcubacteria bacterium]|nr:50S ribosomal protein L4 [Patescibacteria group bacterium]MBU4381151.1 50S ribosomal protein L4 [Patescibacteria group bacterium]MCG2689126.1 50S ribosomal protein L4 [Candidatus Parcubacteria bacterium]